MHGLAVVHATIGCRQQLFGAHSIRGVEGLPNSDGHSLISGNVLSGPSRDASESFCDFTRGRFPQIGYDNSELVATQTSRIVVFTTRVSQPLREQLQKLVALQMTETIIYLFEFVDVCKEYTDR